MVVSGQTVVQPCCICNLSIRCEKLQLSISDVFKARVYTSKRTDWSNIGDVYRYLWTAESLTVLPCGLHTVCTQPRGVNGVPGQVAVPDSGTEFLLVASGGTVAPLVDAVRMVGVWRQITAF